MPKNDTGFNWPLMCPYSLSPEFFPPAESRYLASQEVSVFIGSEVATSQKVVT